MNRIKEIIRVIGRKRMRKIEVFNDSASSGRDNLYFRFYKGLRSGQFRSDTEAASELLDTDPTDKKYLMLKSRVRSRLLNTLFFLDNANTAYERAVYKCNRNLLASKFLLLNGARNTAESILRSTLKEAEKFELTEVVLNCLLSLRFGAAFSGDAAAFDDYKTRYNNTEDLFLAENKSEEYYQTLVLPFGRRSSIRPEMIDQAKAYVAEIEKARKKVSSYRLENTFFRLVVVASQIEGDYEGVIKACAQNEGYIGKKKHLVTKFKYGEIALYRMAAYLQLGKYEKGKETAARSIGYFGEGTTNWVIFLENYLLLCMHTGNYKRASEIFNRVTKHAQFENLDETRKEKWKIFEAFLKYMLGGTIDEAAGENTESQFRLMRFLNEVPTYSKDKRGLNIAIIVLQVLFLLDRGDYQGIIEKAEALKAYCSRYLKPDENYRSNCFLKMVLIMEKRSFEYESTMKVTEKYFNKLKTKRLANQDNLSSLEIIPYESLWTTILAKLRLKR